MKFLILLACFAGIYASVLPNVQQNSTDHRIINGAEIPISQAPYHVSVQTKAGAHQCGGTIIADRWILTTAECAQSVTPTTHQIRYNTNIHSFGDDIAKVIKTHIHPAYQPGKQEFNIALINTADSFPSNIYSKVFLRCGYEKDGEPLLVTGWGSTIDNSGVLSSRLRQVTLPYAGQSCSDYYSSIEIYMNTAMFCAGNLEAGGAGICGGDEGGAAVLKSNNGLYNIITGIASYQFKCGEPWRISLFTRVSTYRKWIADVMGYYLTCSY